MKFIRSAIRALVVGKKPKSTFADYVRRSLLAPASEGSTDRLLEQRLHTFGNDMKVEIYAGDVRAAMRSARLHDNRRPRSLTLSFDWDTGRLHVTDPTDRLRSESVRSLVTLAGDILMNERRNPRFPTEPSLNLPLWPSPLKGLLCAFLLCCSG